MCICVFFQVDQAFTASVENKVTPLTIAVFLKFSSGTEAFWPIFSSWNVCYMYHAYDKE